MSKDIMQVKFKPLGNKVLVKTVPVQTKTASGILIPDTAKEKPLQGIILATGSTTEVLEVGMEILFGQYTGVEIVLDDNKYLVMRETEVIGIV